MAKTGNVITETDLALLLQNKNFVDYLNVYLSLPVFSQRMFYKFEENDFEFDPPIKRSKYSLDRKRLAEWLVKERLPGFIRTDLYFEYLLCAECLATKLHFSDSSHRLDYERHKMEENNALLRECIGHVVGMRHFRHYIAGTPGEKILNFWLDAERYHSLPAADQGARWRLLREIQMKYFKGGLFQTPDSRGDKFDILTHGRKLLASSEWSLAAAPDEQVRGEDLELCSTDTPRRDTPQTGVMATADFSQIQYLVLTVLKDYWVQKYILHCQYVKTKAARKRGTDVTYRIHSTSDLAILRDIKEIDKALKLLQGGSSGGKPSTTKSRRAKFSWKAMFPDHVVDQSFLNQGGEVITLHDNGQITVDPIEEEILDKILERYILSDDSKETSQTLIGSDSHVTGSAVWPANGSERAESQLLSALTRSASVSPVKEMSRRNSLISASDYRFLSSGSQLSVPRRSRLNSSSAQLSSRSTKSLTRVTSQKSGCDDSPGGKPLPAKEMRAQARLRQKRSAEAFIKRVQDVIQKESDKQPKPPEVKFQAAGNPRPSSALDIMRKIARKETNRHPSSLMKASIELFEQLLALNFDPWEEENMDRERPLSCPTEAVRVKPVSTKSKVVRLPKLQGQQEGKEAEDQPPWEGNKLPSITKSEAENGKLAPNPMPDRAVQITTPTFMYRNFCEGYYRYDNKLFVLAIASDGIAGNPFKQFLRKRGFKKKMSALLFWQDAQTFLNTKSDLEQLRQQLRCRRSKILVLRYLSHDSLSLLPPGLMTMLRGMLLQNRGDDLLREAQDFVSKSLYSTWLAYMNEDSASFTRKCIIRIHRVGTERRRKSLSEPRGVGRSQPIKTTHLLSDVSEASNEEQSIHEEIIEESSSFYDKLVPDDSQLRIDLAVQLALDIADEIEEGLPLEPFNVDELIWDAENPAGSLAINKPVIVHRKDILEEIARQKFIAHQRRMRLKLERQRLGEEEQGGQQQQQQEHSIPLYMKPVKKNGVWYQRGARPKSFQDMMRDDIQREFFRRFLIHNGEDAPFHFSQAVNEVKVAKDARSKVTKISAIVKKYFPSASHAVQALKTDADIISTIPAQEKVTQAMLTSAQNWVLRALQDNWYDAYLATYPEAEKTTLLTEAENIVMPSGRNWAKVRTRLLWRGLVSSLVAFRRAILDPKNAKIFCEWLKIEAKKEAEKQQLASSFVPGTPLKTMIKNRLVEMYKLSNDFYFLAEADRYRTLVDTASENVKAGRYYQEDEMMVENKAQTIVKCYIDSDIPPKLQINVSQEHADVALDAYNNGLLERGLFHKLVIAIFPIMAHLWKKFQNWRVERISNEVDERLSAASSKTRQSDARPDFFNMRFLEVKTKKVVRGHEDDNMHITFSMTDGMKLIVPIYHHYQELHYRKGDEPDLQSVMSTASRMHQPRQSLLINRRNATGIGLINSSAEVEIAKLSERIPGSRRSMTARRTSHASRLTLDSSLHHVKRASSHVVSPERHIHESVVKQSGLHESVVKQSGLNETAVKQPGGQFCVLGAVVDL